jgi:hypothetical protein
MRDRILAGAAIVVLTALGYFLFPGHTWLQSDTQIYIPMLEHLWDPSVLAKDSVAVHPHLSFTIYDEVALLLRRVTGLGFREVLTAQQVVFRAAGLLGVILIGTSLGLSVRAALLVTAIFALGATIGGPAVLVFEYEPVPRGFAIPLLIAAIGLAAHGRVLGAEIFASAAFLYHPPTVYPFWLVYFALTLWPANPATMSRRIRALIPIACAVLLMLFLSRNQRGVIEPQEFFSTLEPAVEQLQRMRASYNWVSVWIGTWGAHYLFLWVVSLGAIWRLHRQMSQELRFLSVGMPLVGVLSVPASYLLLEKWKWGMIPQFQPVRAVLFITAFALVLSAIAGVIAAGRGRRLEAIGWLAVAYALPVHTRVLRLASADLANALVRRRVLLVLGLAALATIAGWALLTGRRWAPAAWAVAVVVPFWLIPNWGSVRNYPVLDHAELDALCEWARSSTAKEAVFLFPESGRELHPGAFRATALRAVYVDWKAGGQVNFLKQFGLDWWRRWQAMATKFDGSNTEAYRALGIDYLVVESGDRAVGLTPVYENGRYRVYRISG